MKLREELPNFKAFLEIKNVIIDILVIILVGFCILCICM